MNTLPKELIDAPRWVCQKNKIPMNAKTGARAKSTDPKTWADFETARAALTAGAYDGLGFVFNGDGLLGVDIDHCIDENGNISALAADIIATLDSYTEISPSGTGVHIICNAPGVEIGKKNSALGLELYSTGRYFTVTGNPYHSAARPIRNCKEAISALIGKHFKEQPAPAAALTPARGGQTKTDEEILATMQRVKPEAYALYCGDFGNVARKADGVTPDYSAADLALINYLLGFTRNDAAAADRLFRGSALYRDKWDKRNGNSTYGARTIDYAQRNFTLVENAPGPRARANAQEVIQIHHPEPQNALESITEPRFVAQSSAAYLESDFARDKRLFTAGQGVKTGWPLLDKELDGLYPGLYVLGAISGLGKTTFALQLADQIAQNGERVLYFSLEQTRFELVSKSIAREAFASLPAGYDIAAELEALSSLDIRRGHTTERIKAACKSYMEGAGQDVFIKESAMQETLKSIRETVEAFIEDHNGRAPVVIIDYLQIVASMMETYSDKQRIDEIVKALKILQRDYNLVLVVISSLNRNNYADFISFESFKESGSIEYTADVVWGIQLAAIGEDKKFLKDSGKNDKRLIMKKELEAIPRRLELVCLKNRYGKRYSVNFDYYPQHDFLKDREKKEVDRKAY